MSQEVLVADFIPVSNDDLVAFVAKVESWGTALSSKEQELFDLLLERAKALAPEDLRREQFQEGITVAITSIYAALVRAWSGIDGASTVRVDPIWYKSTSDDGEEIRITATITRKA